MTKIPSQSGQTPEGGARTALGTRPSDPASGAGSDSLESILRNLPVPFCIFDQSGRLLRWSPMFEQASGYSPAQLAGMTPLDTVAPESRPAMERAVRLAFEQGSSEEEAALMTAAGRLRHCLITLNRLVIDGQPCIIGVSVDISKRKRAEDAPRKSEQQYRLLFERNLAGVFRLAPDSTMLDCNPALLRIFGYRSVDEFRALGPRHVFFDPEEGAREFGRLFQEKTVENLEVRLRRADGTPVWAVVNVCLIEDDQGRPAVIEGTCWDMSKRKEAERALRESEERFRELAENIDEVFFVVTENPLRMTYLSPTYEKVWGRPREEAYASPYAWKESVHPEDAPPWSRCWPAAPADLQATLRIASGARTARFATSLPVCSPSSTRRDTSSTVRWASPRTSRCASRRKTNW